MKLLVKIKVIMLLIVLIATGCSSHGQVVIKNRECHVPERVELLALDNKSHIGGEKNIGILMINIADLVGYVRSLEASISCYRENK